METIRERFYFMKKTICLLPLCLVFLSLFGCHNIDGSVTTTKAEEESVLRRIAVVPFLRVAPEDVNAGAVRCPLCGTVTRAEESPADSEAKVERIFSNRLAGSKKFDLIPTDRVDGIFRRVSADSLKAPLEEVLKKAGKELEADGIVMGYVYRFRERKGYPYSVKRPASVAFEIHLVRVKDGALVWRGIFDKTQTSLMENLLLISWFYKERGQWVTAEALADEGMEQLLKTFPGFS